MKVLTPSLKLNIKGFGRAWPEGAAITNLALLEQHPDTAAQPKPFLEELAKRVARIYGFSERYLTHFPGTPFSAVEETSESLCLKAVKKALGVGAVIGSVLAGTPEAFVLGTTTTRRYTGSQATSVLGNFDLQIPAYEIKAGCSTSLASLHFAQALFAQGYESVLVSCAETLSKVINPAVRETWFGLADGGAAIWLGKASEGCQEGGGASRAQFEILKSVYSTHGKYVDMYTTQGDLPPRAETLEAGGYYLSGDSSELREIAKKHYLAMIEALLPEERDRKAITQIIPHQVNRELIDQVVRETGLGGKLNWSAGEFGNLGGASVLFTLSQALEENRFKAGDLILLMSVGGGLSFAAQLWRWG
ncbi:3-oxoacyl-[acyl-carrier-protein] synthase III C-terminal domain-containing protein [Bdellovibrionota bacterium FG-2]